MFSGAARNPINKAVENQIEWERAAGVPPGEGLDGRIGYKDPGTTPARNLASDAEAVFVQASVGFAATGLDQNTGVGVSGAGQRGSGNADRLPGLAEEKTRARRLYYPDVNSIEAVRRS